MFGAIRELKIQILYFIPLNLIKDWAFPYFMKCKSFQNLEQVMWGESILDKSSHLAAYFHEIYESCSFSKEALEFCGIRTFLWNYYNAVKDSSRSQSSLAPTLAPPSSPEHTR